MASSDLKVYLNNFIRQVNAKSSKDDPIRTALNTRTQAYIVNPRVILKEILRPESPFRIQLDRGHLSGTSELRGIARQISEDFWRELKMTSKKFKSYKVVNGKLPPEFISSGDIVVGFDDSKRILYYRGKSGDFYASFRDGIVKPTIDRIKSRTDTRDPLRMYVSPDELVARELSKIDREVNAEAEAQGVTGKPVQARRARARKKYIKENNLPIKPWQGLDIGHVFGAKATGAASLLENPHDVAHNLDNITLANRLAELEPELQEVIESVIKSDIEAVWERVFRNDSVAGKLTLLIPESFVNNRFTGGSAGKLAQSKLNNIVADISKNIHKLQGSPSYEQLVTKLVEEHFIGKRPSGKKYNTKTKQRVRDKSSIAVRNIPLPRSKFKVKEQKPPGFEPALDTSTQGLINFLNEKLHDKIKRNMGKGGSKQTLNYRTGRFARSAKIQALYPVNERNALGAQVKYKRQPYGVFEPGGRLHKPGRDPHRIFGRSIRQLLQEEKIASLRRVKVVLRG